MQKRETSCEAISDASLIDATITGDGEAFRELYERYRDSIYSLIYYIVDCDAPSAEDVLQSVFIKVHCNLHRFRQEATFKTWVYRIAVNEAKNFRRAVRIGKTSLKSIANTPAEFDSRSSPELTHLQRQRRAVVFRAIQELPEKYRTIVILKYVEELSYAQIAEVLALRIGTVASTLNRALLELQRKLKQFENLL
jgi:RNA polymerase sigma-70 factor, ECF subfamily